MTYGVFLNLFKLLQYLLTYNKQVHKRNFVDVAIDDFVLLHGFGGPTQLCR